MCPSAPIEAVPFLEDIGNATQWPLAFQPSLGPLADFLRQPDCGHLCVLELQQGAWCAPHRPDYGWRRCWWLYFYISFYVCVVYRCRLPADADPEGLQEAIVKRDARLTAASVVWGLVSGGMELPVAVPMAK